MAEQKNQISMQDAADKQAELVVNDSLINGLMKQLAQKEQLGMTFPKGYNYANELMGAYLVLKETTDMNKNLVLESCTQPSIAKTLLDMVTLGLSMQKKQCYPVAYAGKLQLQVSVYGNTCNARRYGMKDINAMVIYKNDTFKYHIEDAKNIIDEHLQDFFNLNKDEIVGAYAVVIMEDESKYVEIMNMNMIETAWGQGFGYKKNGNGAHQKFTDQMCMKTVKNRAMKYIIRTHGAQELGDIYEELEGVGNADKVVENTYYEIEQSANSADFEEAEFKEAQQESPKEEPEVKAEPRTEPQAEEKKTPF